nr:MAG TPA: hypothetical protein [Caudoviricetes sp.]
MIVINTLQGNNRIYPLGGGDLCSLKTSYYF